MAIPTFELAINLPFPYAIAPHFPSLMSQAVKTTSEQVTEQVESPVEVEVEQESHAVAPELPE